MSLVGKQFPNIAIKAMDEMGDTFQLNVLDEAVKNKQKKDIDMYAKTNRGYDLFINKLEEAMKTYSPINFE
jgi:hypothetical protein